ncbi:MAG: hypothetical protein E3J56_03615 [Candidatus Aminicenantes bacterium]|nr:MAG: hypothetical protein E3J56_03615 [Candidatus Aminicenantes bacterium]
MNIERLLHLLDSKLEESVEASSDFLEGTESKSRLEGFDLDANKASIGVWGQSAASYEASLSKLVNGWFNSVGTTFKHPKGLSSALSPRLADFEKAMLDSYSKAFQAGTLKMGNSRYRDIKNLSSSDKRRIKRIVSKEMGYLKNFLSGDAKKKLGGKHFRGVGRMQGFVNSLDAQFFRGMLAGAGDNQIFFWELGGAVVMHCPDCIEMNVGSPYLKKNLPTVPRAGETQCHSWCKCVLRAEGLGQAEFGTPFQGSGLPQDASCGCWTDDGMPVAGGVQDLFDDLYRQLNLVRGKIAATADDEMRKRWIGARIQVNQDIINLSKSHQVRVVPRWSVKDIKANVNTLLKKGLVHVTDLRSLADDSTVYLVNGGAMQIGQVEIRDGVLGFNTAGTWIKVDSADDFLIFSGE